jgi:dolichyl-phosphate beta-glucosyltransferase
MTQTPSPSSAQASHPAQQPQTVLVVPCYNEASRLPLAQFDEAATQDWCPRIIFVNDGSTDGTGAMLRSYCERYAGLFEALSLEKNAGKGEAVRRGLLHGIESGARFVAYFDADLATPLQELPLFERVLEEDSSLRVVLGSRVRLLGRHVDRSLIRHLAGRVFATSASLALELPVYDTQCGAKMLRVTPALSDALSQPFTSRWLFDIELLFRLRSHEADAAAFERTLYELPLRTWKDVQGSKVKPADFFRALWQVWQLRRRYGSAKR